MTAHDTTFSDSHAEENYAVSYFLTGVDPANAAGNREGWNFHYGFTLEGARHQAHRTMVDGLTPAGLPEGGRVSRVSIWRQHTSPWKHVEEVPSRILSIH